MSFVGSERNQVEYGLHISMAVIAGLLVVVQIYYILHMKLFTVYLLPLISFVVCFENTVLSYNDSIDTCSVTAYFTYIFHSAKTPLMVVVLYEASYRLFETRTAQFICFPFDQGSDFSKTLAISSLWIIRLIACGLYVISILANLLECSNGGIPGSGSGRGGYLYLSNHPDSGVTWMTLVPPIVLSITSLVIGGAFARYGNSLTIGINSRGRWKLLFVTALCQVIGQIFNENVYLLTSNGGDLFLLVGITYTFHLIEEDLTLTAIFADYLHKSNMAFEHQHQLDIETSGKLEEAGDRLVEMVTRHNTGQSHSTVASNTGAVHHHRHQHNTHHTHHEVRQHEEAPPRIAAIEGRRPQEGSTEESKV